MFLNCDNRESDTKNSPRVLALNNSVEETFRLRALELKKDGSIEYPYGFVDSLSASYSMFKYFFDFCNSNKDPNAMHDMLMTPSGICIITAEMVFLVLFSVLSVKFEKDGETPFEKNVALAWPFFRDVMKALKNSYKGWRSAIVAMSLISETDLKCFINPIGIALGILAAANRCWIRDMRDKRKAMMSVNEQLLIEIESLHSVTYETRQSYVFNSIQGQKDETRILAYFLVGAGGAVDGLYLYFGVLGLAALSFPMIYTLTVICLIYTIACIITRVFEEYEFQQKLILTQTACNLGLIAKQLETSWNEFLLLQSKTDKSKEDIAELYRLKNALGYVLEDFETYRKIMEQQANHSFTSAALLGLKNGLYAYGALTSILFLVSTLVTLAGAGFPPLLLIIPVFIGLAFMVIFPIHSVLTNYYFLPEEDTKIIRPYAYLVDLKTQLYTNSDLSYVPGTEFFKEAVKDGILVRRPVPSFIQEWLEIVRSLFTGLSKGQKFGGFVFNFMQKPDESGVYHESAPLLVIELISALCCGAILAVRAFARGFARPSLSEKVQLPEAKPPINETTDPISCNEEATVEPSLHSRSSPDSSTPKKTREALEKESGEGASPCVHSRPASPLHSNSYTSLSMFAKNNISRVRITRSEGDFSAIAHDLELRNTIQGLA